MKIVHKKNLTFTDDNGRSFTYDKFYLRIDTDLFDVLEIPLGTTKDKPYLLALMKTGDIEIYEE